MTARNSTLAKIHIAKKNLGLDDDTYRAALERVTGEASCRDMSNYQLDKVLSHFKARGWKPHVRNRKSEVGSQKKNNFRAPAKRLDIRLIYALWWNLHKDGKLSCDKAEVRAALHTFIKKRFGIDNPEWLPIPDAGKVIEALKAMNKRR